MKIRQEYNRDFEVEAIDSDNEIEFSIDGQGNYVTSWLNISETIELIKFLQEQVDTFNNKMI